MTIRNWPTHEQPREKLLHKGAAALSDAELLAIFMRTGIQGKSAVDLSREMLTQWGGLRHTLEASQAVFCEKPGCGTVKYVQLQAALELGRRYLEATLSHGHALADPQATYRYLTAHLRHERQEVFACLFLDNQHRILCYEEIARGTLNEAMVYPREIVKRALHHNAAAIILSHNHPSGVAQPSGADKALTEKLKKALALIDTRVLDHIIIGEGETFSFAQWGLI